MGKLHARVVSEMPHVQLACVVDTNPDAAGAVAEQRKCKAMDSPQNAVEMVDAAIIATPTVEHVASARPFIAAGVPVLIEKPFTDNPDAGDELIDLAARTGTTVQVGHTERFNPVVEAIVRYAIRPKFIEAHRISPFTFRSADVGVVLDMMIHDLDLVLMLVCSAVRSVRAVGVNVVGKHEDICNARLEFQNGCVANVTASRLSVKTEREMRVFSEQAYLSMDYAHKTGVVIKKSENLDLIQMARRLDVDDIAELAQSVDYKNLLKFEQLTFDDSTEPLRKQVEAFVRSIVRNLPPKVSGREGLAAVRLAQKIVACVKQHRWDGDASPRRGLDII